LLKSLKSYIFARDLLGEGAKMLPLFYKVNMIQDKIIPIIEEKLTEEGFEDCYIVEIKIKQNSKVFVYIDCDLGLPIRKCVSISRRIEHYLDESLILGEKYTLEVSSPGLEKPLVKRQFKKNIGRDLAIKLNDDSSVKGTFLSLNDEGIVLEIMDKKKKKQIDISFEDIREAKVIIKFNKKKK